MSETRALPRLYNLPGKRTRRGGWNSRLFAACLAHDSLTADEMREWIASQIGIDVSKWTVRRWGLGSTNVRPANAEIEKFLLLWMRRRGGLLWKLGLVENDGS